MKKIFVVCLTLSLSACATSPITEQTGRHVSNDRIYAKELVSSTASPSKARVSFFRDTGIFGSACSYDIFVNNVKVFSINQGEFIHLLLEPGSYFYRLETNSICTGLAISQNTVLKEGGKETYRIHISSDEVLRITRIE